MNMLFPLALSWWWPADASVCFSISVFYWKTCINIIILLSLSYYWVFLSPLSLSFTYNSFQMWPCVRRQSTSHSPHCVYPRCPWSGCWRVFPGEEWIVRAWRGWRKCALPSNRSSSCCDCGENKTKTRTSCMASYKVQTKSALLVSAGS